MNIGKKPLRNRKMRVGGLEDQPGEMMDEYKEPDSWSIITAMSRVLDVSEGSQLSDDFWETCKNPLAFLRQELGLTNIQIVIVSILVEVGEPMSWKRIGNFLGCSRLSVMVHSDEMEELVSKRWICHKSVHDIGGMVEGFALSRGVVVSLRNNKTFVPEKIDGLSEQQFVDMLESRIVKNMRSRNADFREDEDWMYQMVKANSHLPLCHELLKYDDIHVISLMLLIVVDYAQWEGSENALL